MNKKLPGLGFVLIIIPLIIASWFLVHTLAVFGIFLAIAYPLWWLFLPNKTACLLCRVGSEGEECFFCKREIKKKKNVSPSSLASAIFNGILILAFSLASLAVVIGESRLLSKLGFPPTDKTVSFIIPGKGQYRLGEIFPMKIEIAGIKTPINAVQADIGFDQNKLEIEEISTEGSFANIFIQKELNNEGGYARLTGGLANPGFFGDRGLFGTAFFKGKAPGLVKIEFLPSSMVLANDGHGTNVLRELAEVSYLILPERVSEEEEEMQESTVIRPVVLGEKSDDTQMKFYDESEILGAETEQEGREKKELNLLQMFLNGVEKADSLILSLWRKSFSFF